VCMHMLYTHNNQDCICLPLINTRHPEKCLLGGANAMIDERHGTGFIVVWILVPMGRCKVQLKPTQCMYNDRFVSGLILNERIV
jgi:hypothetical protein